MVVFPYTGYIDPRSGDIHGLRACFDFQLKAKIKEARFACRIASAFVLTHIDQLAGRPGICKIIWLTEIFPFISIDLVVHYDWPNVRFH